MGRRRSSELSAEEAGTNRFRVLSLDPRDPEWSRAWNGLCLLTGDFDRLAEEPRTREVWGYSYSEQAQEEGAVRYRHVFRHRRHPRTHSRQLLTIDASPGWPYIDLSARSVEGDDEQRFDAR
jgi:hypothetical protein